MESIKLTLNHIDDYITQLSTNSNTDDITIEELLSVKNNYVHLRWIFQECEKIKEKIEQIDAKYVEIVSPLIADINPLSYKYDDWGEIAKHDNITSRLSMLMVSDDSQQITTDQFEESVPSVSNEQCVDSIVQPRTEQAKKIETKTVGLYKYIYAGKEILIPAVQQLDDIPSSIYYYYGDDRYKKGIYTRINDNTIVEIPIHVDVVSENTEMKHFTIRCSEGNKCNKWKCSFQHPGGEYKKIGYKVRCPSRPRFSGMSTFESDVESISYEDVRLCLMYSLTDIFCSMVWCQRFGADKSLVMTDIQICDDYEDPFRK